MIEGFVLPDVLAKARLIRRAETLLIELVILASEVISRFFSSTKGLRIKCTWFGMTTARWSRALF
jgi:hypothetical protein